MRDANTTKGSGMITNDTNCLGRLGNLVINKRTGNRYLIVRNLDDKYSETFEFYPRCSFLSGQLSNEPWLRDYSPYYTLFLTILE